MCTPSLLIRFIVFAVMVPPRAEAQVERPIANTVAIGADVGFLAPDNGAASSVAPLQTATGSVDAFVEYYYTPRTSLRVMYAWAAPEFEMRPGSLRRQHLNVNFVYNWEIGRFRPFATVGGGAYFLSRRDADPPLGDAIAKPGGSVGWGGEFYLRTFAVKSEMSVHILSDETDFPELSGNTLAAFTWTFGIKIPL